MKKLFTFLTLLLCVATSFAQPAPDCSNYAGVDFFSFYGNEICNNYYGGAGIELNIITNGPPMGEFYDVFIEGTDGSQNFGFADDYGFGFAELLPNPVEGCEVVEVSFQMTINCPETGEPLDVIDLGVFTIYPQLTVEIVEPGCGEGQNGSATLVAANGEICEGPIEGIAGIAGDCESQRPATLTYDFNPFPDALYCFFNFSDVVEVPCNDLEFGCTDPAACNFSDTAVCDDGSCLVVDPCCPRPVAATLPTGFCIGGGYPDINTCIIFDGDISAIDIYGIGLNSANGFGFVVSNDPATNEICFALDFFYYNYYDICQPVEDTFTLDYFCPDTGEQVNIDLGTITIFPPPFVYEVSTQPSAECGGIPEINPLFCGELVIGEIVDPINECDNLTAGVLNYDIDPGFDLTGAPDCLTALLAGEVLIPPCEEDCPCEGTFCGGTCIDLMVSTDQFPITQCAYAAEPFTINISGQGADTGTYFGNIIDNNGNFVGSFFHQPGDPTDIDIFAGFYQGGCEPTTYQLSYEIFCAQDGSLIASGPLGDITVYPESFLFFPEVIEGQPCGAGPTILPAPCGTVVTDPDPIPNPQCGENAMDQLVTWSVDFGFDITDAPSCFEPGLFGEFTVFACPDGPGAPCILECLGDGILDENCTCVVEGAPQIIIDDAPVAVCQGEPIIVNVDLTGTIPPGQFYELQVVDQNGNFINSFGIDEYTVFPFAVDLFDFNYGDPCNTRTVTYTFNLRCFYDFSLIGTPVIVGPITIYPSPFNYAPFIEPTIPCESEPQFILNDFCEATLEILETVLPVDDCDAPMAGFISYQVTPAFDITNAPACFTDLISGQAPIPPCLVDCPCDGTFCQNVCVDLMATVTNFPTEVCPDEGFQYQLDVTGIGADFGTYFILTFDNNGNNVGFDVHNPGDPTTIFSFVFPFVQGCEPEDQTFSYEIQCPDDGSILAAGTLGTVLVYPSPFNFFPQITPSIACVQNLMITPAPCGTLILNPDPIPVPGCGGEDSEVSWSVDFGFDYPPECYAFPIEGTEQVFACNGVPGEPCDDNNPCTTNDMLDENCSCIGEGPTVLSDTVLPNAVCVGEPLVVTVTVDMDPGPDGLFVIVNDQFGNFPGFVQIFPGDPLTFDIDVFPFTQSPCDIEDLELFLEIRCPYTFGLIGQQVPLGTVTIYPDVSSFIPQITPSISCEEPPIITAGFCGTITTTITPPDPIACPAGANGFVNWMVDAGIDVGVPPACFDITLLSGQEPITACSNCCPIVVDVSIADAGPFCSGDMTEVCVTFDAAFETDAQITINGIDAVAGDDQICFQLDLVNNGCSYEPTQIPFEIICNDDGSVNNGVAPDLLVAPDPANFQYQVFPGGCGFPPNVGPTNNSPCLVFSGYPPIIVSDPLDGCPPIDGQVEIPLDYFDQNFNMLDVAAFGCDGFETSILLPQPGCTTCQCPNPVVSAIISEVVCEGGLYEICIEFEVGDEANAIGTQVNINGDAGTFAFFTVSGDGVSTVYCSEFNSGAVVQCEPITENFTIDLFCATDGTPLFNGAATTTVYPLLDKFTYEVTPAVDNCPLAAVTPQIISTGQCELGIVTNISTAPVDGCPPVAGELTYSVNYLDAALFANAPECLFTPVIDAVEPIPACDTCEPQECMIMPNMATNIVCDDNGTPTDPNDDTYTFEILINGSNSAVGASNTFNDDQGNMGIAYGTTLSYGPYTIAGGNVTVNFIDVDDANCFAMMMATAPATCSNEVICEDEIMGTVFAPTGCGIAGITITIYDNMGAVVTTLTTNANGIYDSSPTTYPCGNYTAELTANLPACYTGANGETGPKPFVVDNDAMNNDTDGADFMAEEPPACSIVVEVSELLCDNNETPQDGTDDIVTITVTVTSTGPWTAADGTMGVDGDTYTFPATLANNTVSMMFSVDGEVDCTTDFSMIVADCDVPAIPTLSQWGLIILALLMMCFGAIKMSCSVRLVEKIYR